MTTLLTGGNGFIGSHILDALRESGHEVRLLLRETSNTDFIERHLSDVRVFYGDLLQISALEEAVQDVECIIHCAGKTKALSLDEYYRVNRDGTSNLIHVANRYAAPSCHFIHMSSRAVLPPATTDDPTDEDTAPDPVSDYGRSKMEAEHSVMGECNLPWTILRPSAVFGPRDTDFYGAFRSIKWHILPLIDGGTQPLSLAYGPDVAAAVTRCMETSESHRSVYNVASPTIHRIADFMNAIARAMNKWTIPLYLPSVLLYPVCLFHELRGQLTGSPTILNKQKYGELTAEGWACSAAKMEEELNFVCATDIETGIDETLQWYRSRNWL